MNNINDRLYTKISGEYDNFIENLKTLPPEQVIEKSYEKVFKEDILLTIEGENLSPEKAKALLKLEKPLDSLYHAWLETDASYMDRLYDCVEGYADKMIAENRRVHAAER